MIQMGERGPSHVTLRLLPNFGESQPLLSLNNPFLNGRSVELNRRQQNKAMSEPCPPIDVVSGSFDLGPDLGQLITHGDSRGGLTEIFREEWPSVPPLRQWNFLRNRPNVLRGMHVHFYHSDYVIVIEGEMLLALHDLRRESPSYGESGILRLRGDRLSYAFIRPGIVHGFYSPNGNLLVYGLTHSWDMDDELGCRWDDRDLGLDWPPFDDPVLSERDSQYGSFRQLKTEFKSIRYES